MDEAGQLDRRGALGADREDILSGPQDIAGWVERTLGHTPRDVRLFERALTHASRSDAHYERLEFLGDRVLGLVIGDWLYGQFPDEPEGKLSRRFHALVDGTTCAEIGRELGVGRELILGKQARDDGAADSDNVIGDAVEALIGALYREGGLEAATAFIRKAWGDRVVSQDRAPKHPKSALQEWAAAKDKRTPTYSLASRRGPHHAPRFVVEVSIPGVGEASAEGASKQEAETAAAKALLEKLK